MAHVHAGDLDGVEREVGQHRLQQIAPARRAALEALLLDVGLGGGLGYVDRARQGFLHAPDALDLADDALSVVERRVQWRVGLGEEHVGPAALARALDPGELADDGVLQLLGGLRPDSPRIEQYTRQGPAAVLGLGGADAVVLVHQLHGPRDQGLRVALAVHFVQAQQEERVEPGHGRRGPLGLHEARHALDGGQDGVRVAVPDFPQRQVALAFAVALARRGLGDVGVRVGGFEGGLDQSRLLAQGLGLARVVDRALGQNLLGVAVLPQVLAVLGQGIVEGHEDAVGIPRRVQVVGDGVPRRHLEVLGRHVVHDEAAGDDTLDLALQRDQLAVEVSQDGFLVALA